LSRKWKKTVTALMVAAATALLVACGGSDGDSSSAGDSLVIGGWGGTIDKATQKHYIDKYIADGGDVTKFSFVDAPSAQLARVEAQAKAGKIEWDLIDSAPGPEAYLLNAKGLLAKLPSDLKQELVDELGEQRVTDFGFSHANVGNVIVCNMDKMDSCPRNMKEFFDPKKFPQTRTIAGNNPLINATAAELAAGVPREDTATTPVNLDQVFDQLDRIRDTVRVFHQSGDQQMQVMRNGEADMGILWSGRAYSLLDEGMNLEIVWNDAIYEPSFWTVVKDAPNEEGAFDFLRWLAKQPEAQAGWAEELNYSVPHPKAFDFLSEKDAKRQADYPANFEVMAIPNWDWYAQPENKSELDSRFQSYLRG